MRQQYLDLIGLRFSSIFFSFRFNSSYVFPTSQQINFPVSFFHRHIYWTDWGDIPKIKRANLDGSQQITLVDTELQLPNGLVVDFEGMGVLGQASEFVPSEFT